MKIRGTASHIAEKYMSLARDALASGDMVTAESYLQHAEHYNRIIMAAQAQATPPSPQAQAGDQANGGQRGGRQSAEAAEEATPPAEAAGANAGEAPRGERGRGRQGRNGAQPETSKPEPAEAAAADEGEGESTPDAVS